MTEFDREEKRIVVGILIAIMEADGIIDPRETAFLDSILLEFGLTEAELDMIDELDFNQMLQGFRQFEPAKKRTAIQYFVGMANSDDYADPRELRIIEQLGKWY